MHIKLSAHAEMKFAVNRDALRIVLDVKLLWWAIIKASRPERTALWHSAGKEANVSFQNVFL